MTKLSDEIERRLTASAGYDSLVHCQTVAARGGPARSPRGCRAPPGRRRRPNVSPLAVNGSSNAAHFTWSTRMCRLSGLISARSGERVEEVRRVADDELVERRAAADQHRRRAAAAAAGAAGALPGRGDRPGIAGHHADVERADVDPELERVGRDHRADAALAQPLLDLAAPLRQVAAAIAADPVLRPRPARRSRPSGRWSGSRSTAGSARRRSAGAIA